MRDFNKLSGRVSARIIRILGEPVTLPDKSVVSGVFDFATEDGQLARLDIRYRTPVLTLSDSDVVGLNEHDRVTIRGKVYTIDRFEPDGAGITEIPLVEDQPDPDSGSWR